MVVLYVEMPGNRSSEKKRLPVMKKLLNELFEKTYLVAFLGHIDATETTYKVCEVTQVLL